MVKTLRRRRLLRKKTNMNIKKRTPHNKKRRTYKKIIYKKIRSTKGGNGEEESCSMCCKVIAGQKLIPNECFMKYGKYKAHKICEKCWWGEFAKEGVSHSCPGCVKKLPLNQPNVQPSEVVDLTEDD